MDITQIILFATLIIITIFIVVIGFQVFFTLRDFRKTMLRVNRLLDSSDDLVAQLKKPVVTAGNLFGALTAGVGVAHLLKRGQEGKNVRDKR